MYRIALAVVSLALVLAIMAVINRHFLPSNRSLAIPVIADTITFEDNRFIPTFTTVKSGESIIIKNNAPTPLTLSTDANGPAALINLTIPAGLSQTITLSQLGAFKLHDQAHPETTAQVSVE